MCIRDSTRTSGYARENNLRHTPCFQLSFQVGVRKSAPGAFGDEDVVWLRMQFVHQLTEAGGKLPAPPRLLCPPRSSSRDVDQNHRQLLLAKGLDQLTGMVDEDVYKRQLPRSLK